MPQLGPAEILVIILVALLVFGPQRLPGMMRQAGRGLAELRKFQDELRDELHNVMNQDDDEDESPASRPPESLPPPPPPHGAAPAPLPSAEHRPLPPAASSPNPGVRAPSRFRTPSGPPPAPTT
jgi:Tat protein translocase TatB subunit